MNKIYTLPEDELKGEIYRRILLLMGKNLWKWESVTAAVSLFGGLLSIVLGALVWAVVGLFAPAGALGRFLDVAGTILFVLPLPLLALGAYCLDLLEKKPPALPLPVESQPDAARPMIQPLRAVRKGKHTLNLILAASMAALSPVLPATARAQQTVFNVPTTDVLERGKVYAELGVNARLTLAADCVTGRHASGYFTPGAIFKPHPQVTGYAGYSVGNGGGASGNHFFLLEVGFNFN
jgi:hypothetical protein